MCVCVCVCMCVCVCARARGGVRPGRDGGDTSAQRVEATEAARGEEHEEGLFDPDADPAREDPPENTTRAMDTKGIEGVVVTEAMLGVRREEAQTPRQETDEECPGAVHLSPQTRVWTWVWVRARMCVEGHWLGEGEVTGEG